MPDLQDGESVEMKGSAKQPYVIKNTGGVYSCTCPAWRNQSLPIEQRTCKHISSVQAASVGPSRRSAPRQKLDIRARKSVGREARAG